MQRVFFWIIYYQILHILRDFFVWFRLNAKQSGAGCYAYLQQIKNVENKLMFTLRLIM